MKKSKPQSKHAVDEMAGQQGFHVLHLPVGHCELNPIERIWAQIKGEVAKKNIMFCLKDAQTLTSNAIENLTPENWRKASKHILQVEENYWKSDHIQEEMVNELRINISDGEEEDDSKGSESGAMSDIEKLKTVNKIVNFCSNFVILASNFREYRW